MADFSVKDGQFWLNGRPQLIQAGEFHYFRTPREAWPHRLGLLQQAGFNAVAAYIPWLWHQPEADMMDLDGRTHPLRDLVGFLDLAATMGLLIIARPGPYIMAETINEGIPPWLFARYPQVAMISQTQQAQNIASYLHPDFLAGVRHWYRAVFTILAPRQIGRQGNIILIQLDNEMGMPHWVRNVFDANPDTLARFADDLRAAYGARLAARYPTGDLPAFLHAGLTQPAAPYAAAIVADYRRFYRRYLRQYATFLWDEARANGMETPPIVNIHGFANGGKTFPIGLSQLVEVMELPGMISATDVYPLTLGEGNFHQLLLLNEMTKALQNQAQPLFSVEFQAGGNQDFGAGQSSFYDLHGRLSISQGMRAINHYLFFDGENDPLLSPVRRHDWGHPVRKDGTVRRHYPRYAQLSAALHAYGDALTLAQPRTITTVGFLLDYFMTEVNNAFTQPAANILTHQREVILFDLIARALALTHRPFQALELSRAPLDPAQTPLCWVMMEQQCPAAVQQKLVNYLQQGGKLILIGRLCVETFDHTPCTLLQEALGIGQIESDPPFTANTMRAFAHQDVPVSFLQRYSAADDGRFAEVFASDADGRAVGIIQRVGQGRALLLGAALAANTLEDLDIVQQMALQMGCPPLFTLSDWLDVRISEGDNGRFLFLNNYQDDPISAAIACQGEPLCGGHPIHVPARQGLILPLAWQVCPEVTLHYATGEVRAVINAGDRLELHIAQAEFVAELTLPVDWQVAGERVEVVWQTAVSQQIRLHSQGQNAIVLRRHHK